ncbi:MAG: putative lipid II flippase FtsW [Gammaproteobacteria bacterium]|nr:putative lipid II flippase FtsW [Gammaproteobacteria bacterium]
MDRRRTIKADRANNFESGLGRKYDQWLLTTIVIMLSLGAVMVYSATIAGDKKMLSTNYNTLATHLAHIALGFGFLIAASFVRIEWLQAVSKKVMLLGLLLLSLVLIPGLGVEVNGSMRWFDIMGLRFQPSELVKIASLIYFSDYLSRKSEELHLFKVGIFNIGLVVGAIGLLLMLEPDFGTTVVIVATAGCMMFLAGVRFWHFIFSSSVAMVLMAGILVMAPYRLNRLLSFQDPWADPYNSGFQLSQALIAIGRGEWFGAGLGGSIQKLFYLPHASNDFLVAITGEELGAVGILFVLVLFGLFLFRAFHIAAGAFRVGNRFAGLLAQGIGLLFALQASVHVGVNIGLLPTKGLTLPFMSYGGSSMVTAMLAVGLLISVDKQCQIKSRKPK